MIIDSLDNLEKYTSINPLFSKVCDFLQQNDLNALTTGRHDIQGDDLFVNICETGIRTREEAKLETHNEMIDIQICMSGSEMHGYTPRKHLAETAYDAQNDISFYDGEAETYYPIHTDQFAIYFPSDGHAPAISDTGLRKAIFKVRNI